MPAPFIPRRVEDFIFYYYAKLVIAPSAGFRGNYRFIVKTYEKLKSGEIRMSDCEREILRLAQQPGTCVYCGKADPRASPSEVVPRSLGGPIGLHNSVLACESCRASKGERDLVDWWINVLKRDHETLPRIPIGLYLKLAYERHQIDFSLDVKYTDLAQISPLPRAEKVK